MEAMELIQLTEIRTVHPANDVSKAQMIADQKKIKEQDKISLEAGRQEGRREVVEWIQQNHQYVGLCHPDAFVDWIQIEMNKWQAQLKEWGIQEV